MASAEAHVFRWKALAGILIFVGSFCVALVMGRPSITEEFEYRTWDWRLRAIATPPVDTPLRILNIDQASIDYLATNESLVYPWPRGIYIPILNYLKAAGATAVGFDMVFLEPSSYGVDDDRSLADTITPELPVVTAVVLRRDETAESADDVAAFVKRQRQNAPLLKKYQIPSSAVEFFKGLSLPVAPLLEKSHAFGDVEGAPDSDGIYRRFKIAGKNLVGGEIQTLKLPLALLALARPAATIDFTPYVDSSGKLPVRFYGPKGTIPTESLANIFISWQNIEAGLSPLIPLEKYKDSIVFIGTDAPALLDLRPTPLSPSFPGVELNATVLQNVLDGIFIRRVEGPWDSIIALLIVAMIACASLFLSGKWQSGAIVLLVGGYIGAAFLAADAGIWVPMAVPLLGMAMSLMASLAMQYLIEGQQHRFIRDAFRHYVSPAIIDRIVEDPGQLQLGGEKRELTIFFSDIAGFTTISESLDAKRLVALLNEYLTAVTDIILSYGGTVDKYVGDAVVAFWNAPLSVPDHAQRGVDAALEIQEALLRLQPKFEKEYGVVVKTRIGLNSGAVSVGNFGSAARFNYTVIGDAANLASRLEGANKAFGTLMMIADRTRSLLGPQTACRKIGELKVVGKTEGVEVFEPLSSAHPMRDPSMLATYSAALDLFARGELEQARVLFGKLSEDPVARKYCARIELEQTKGGDPASSEWRSQWSPQWNLTEK